MGPHRPARTLAQLSNIVPPTARWYEHIWRRRSLTLLSGRPFPNHEELDELAAALHPGPGRTMVDVGCSEGLYARALARSGSPVIAVDHSLAFLARLRDRCRAEGLDVLAVRSLAQHLPIRDDSVSGVAIGGSLNEIGDQHAAVAEAARIMGPDSRFFSMHLVRSQTWKGRMAQLLARSAGIEFPTLSGTHLLLRGAGLAATDVRTDAVVVRITAVPDVSPEGSAAGAQEK